MSYYILPKQNRKIPINPLYSQQALQVIISYSLFHYLNKTKEQVYNINSSDYLYPNDEEESFIHDSDDIDNIIAHDIHKLTTKKNYTREYISNILNPYEFVFLCVPDSKYSVSKLKPASNTFYIIMEILYTFKIIDLFANKIINTLHIGEEININSSIDCLNTLRDEYNDNNQQIVLDSDDKFYFQPQLHTDLKKSTDLLYFELLKNSYNNTNNYICGLVYVLCNILNYQSQKGICIIKMDTLYYKPILDILYMLSGMYDKMYIIKPNVLNILTSERYIVCKYFSANDVETKTMLNKLSAILLGLSNKSQISSFFSTELPYYFLNKVEESNIIIGHQQLYVMDQMINIMKHKNVEDKIETLKKYHIQKSIQWCEKYKIPYNKFLDKVNIFLPSAIACDELTVCA